MTFGTTVTIDGQDIDVTVKGDFMPGSAQTMDDPGESASFDIESVIRDDTVEDITNSLDNETTESIERMGAEDHTDDDGDDWEYDDLDNVA